MEFPQSRASYGKSAGIRAYRGVRFQRLRMLVLALAKSPYRNMADEVGFAEVAAYSPTLADKLAVSSLNGLDYVIEKVLLAMK